MEKQNNRDYVRGCKDAFARALYLVAQHDPQTGYETNPNYWGQTLRNDLIQEEITATKLLAAHTPIKE